MAHRNLKGQRN